MSSFTVLIYMPITVGCGEEEECREEGVQQGRRGENGQDQEPEVSTTSSSTYTPLVSTWIFIVNSDFLPFPLMV